MDKSDQSTPTAMRTAESWAETIEEVAIDTIDMAEIYTHLTVFDKDAVKDVIRAIQADALKSVEASRGVLPDNWVAVPKEMMDATLQLLMPTHFFGHPEASEESKRRWFFNQEENFRNIYKKTIQHTPPCPIIIEADVAAKARREALEEAIDLMPGQYAQNDQDTSASAIAWNKAIFSYRNAIRALISKETTT